MFNTSGENVEKENVCASTSCFPLGKKTVSTQSFCLCTVRRSDSSLIEQVADNHTPLFHGH